MREEQLSIKTGGEWKILDLSTPSGITLKYNNAMFGNITNITGSFSYTFKLPVTNRNSNILNNADDTRISTTGRYKVFECRYTINGILSFKNATLYIDSIEGCFNCCMIWGEAAVLGKIKDDDLTLNDLKDLDEIAWFYDSTNGNCKEFDNEAKCLRSLMFNSGICKYNFHYDQRWQHPTNTIFGNTPPCVPVKRIMDIIGQMYEIRLPIVRHISPQNWDNEGMSLEDKFNKGVLPVIKRTLSSENYKTLGLQLSSVYFSNQCEEDGITFLNRVLFRHYIINGETDGVISNNGLIGTGHKIAGGVCGFWVSAFVSLEVKGILKVGFKDVPRYEVPTLQLVISNFDDGEYDEEVLIERKGAPEGGTWTFDFSSVPMSIEELDESKVIYFKFSHEILSIAQTGNIWIVPTDIGENNSLGCCNLRLGMPNIKLLDFLKYMFYMTGTFPLFVDGQLIAAKYDVLLDNIKSGIIRNWSDKVLRKDEDMPVKVTAKHSDYARINYFMMNNDNEGESSAESTDVYASGKGWFPLSSQLINSTSKTVVKLPYNAAYLKNKDFPNEEVGSTYKLYEWSDKSVAGVGPITKLVNAKPIFGIVYDREVSHLDNNGNYVKDGYVKSIKPWSEWSEVLQTDSMRYLIKILDKPLVVTENMSLDEFELQELDYRIPVYLSQHNSYFGVLSIQVDSKGFCKVELIRLPTDI